MGYSLAETAMLVKFASHGWQRVKSCPKAQRDAAEKNGVESRRVKGGKVCVADCQELDAVYSVVTEFRGFYYANTVPWRDDGKRLLLASNFDNFTRGCRGFHSKLEQAVNALASIWDYHVRKDETDLNGLHDAADYPSVSELSERFSVKLDYEPLTDAADFRVKLRDEDAERIRASITAENDKAMNAAMRDVWSRLYEPVKHMADRLRDSDAIFRDSLVGNVLDIVKLLPRLNLTGDAELESLRAEVESKLCRYNPDTLREVPDLRAQAAKEAAAIADKMSAYMGS